jgi:hypothetical protein
MESLEIIGVRLQSRFITQTTLFQNLQKYNHEGERDFILN